MSLLIGIDPFYYRKVIVERVLRQHSEFLLLSKKPPTSIPKVREKER